MKAKLAVLFLAAGGVWLASDVLAYRRAEAAKWANFQKFPYLSVEDDWCRARRVAQKHCLTPGNLARLALQGR
jgi:hypothetical protein